MKKIAIISFSNLKFDSRVNRQIKFLHDKYRVFTIGFGYPRFRVDHHFEVRSYKRDFFYLTKTLVVMIMRLYERYYFSLPYIKETEAVLQENEFDLIVANDVDTLPVVLKYKKRAKVILDAHEYAPKEFANLFLWRLLRMPYKSWLCDYIQYVDEMITVSSGIASEYYRNYNVLPKVITNAPQYEPYLKPKRLQQGKIKIIHHGGAIKSRKLENLLRIMKYLDDRWELYLMLLPTDLNYYKFLRKVASKMRNVYFVDPVPVTDVVRVINNYDIGLYILPPHNLNEKYALPNKFFEFIQARLCVVIGPSVEMAKYVHRYRIGVVANSFSPEDVAKTIRNLNEDYIYQCKMNSHRYAYELSSEKNKKLFLELIDSVLEA